MKTICQLLLLSLVLLAVACVPSLDAQQFSTEDSLDYFPYRAGDSWRMRHQTGDYPPVTYHVLRDSIEDGNRFLILNEPLRNSNTVEVRVDPSGDVYTDPHSASPNLLYRLRAQVGDRWRMNDDSVTPYYITCTAVFTSTVLGEPRTVKAFDYWYDLSGAGLSDSNWYASRYLARGLGEIQQFYEPGILFYISGATIDGEAYGDMIAGITGGTTSSSLRIAPNPFTERATLTYYLNSSSHVRLRLIDPLGNNVATAVDEVQGRGEHRASIDGTALPAGTYFYQLRTSTHTITGTLVRHF